MRKKKIAILGGGNLGGAIAEGLIKSQFVSSEQITVTRRNVGALSHLKAEEKGLMLSVAVDPTVDRCFRGDPLRLRQVITNLVSNAIKFTERGSVRIEAARAWWKSEFVYADPDYPRPDFDPIYHMGRITARLGDFALAETLYAIHHRLAQRAAVPASCKFLHAGGISPCGCVDRRYRRRLFRDANDGQRRKPRDG